MANYTTVAGMSTTSASGNVTAETAFGLAPANTVRAFISLPAYLTGTGNALDGREMSLRAAFLVTTGGSLTWTPSIRLYSGGNTGLTTFTNDTAIITPSAITIATATRLVTIDASIWWDQTTQRLAGSYQLLADTTYTGRATLTAGLSAGVATAGAIQWCVTGIFGTTNASNTAVLKYFEVDIV